MPLPPARQALLRTTLESLGVEDLTLRVRSGQHVRPDELRGILREVRELARLTLAIECRGGHAAQKEALAIGPILVAAREFVETVELRVMEGPVSDLVEATTQAGFSVALGGPAIRGDALEELAVRGGLDALTAISLRSPQDAARAADLLTRHGSDARLWIGGLGADLPAERDIDHLRCMLDAFAAPVERISWRAFPGGDEESSPMLHHIWRSHGLEGLRDASWLAEPLNLPPNEKPVLITGGAGFVGTNLAHRLLVEGRAVLLVDNLSRAGTYDNLRWLRAQHGERARILLGDVREERVLREATRAASAVVHLAAQVAVTTSVDQPRHDFDVNARGAINLLEALRARDEPVPLVFTSTNKVYGAMADVRLRADATRHVPEDEAARRHGFDESRPLDFHSPYGCSKGAADQYVLDYARTYGMPNVVLRMSCVYGPHQHGTEDQGWVAHFLLAGMRDEPLTIYGDGRQVRDVLFVEDLVDAFLLSLENAERLRGRAFNIGGGPRNTLSLLELVERLPALQSRKPDVRFAPMRPGDQPYYVSDTRAFEHATGWRANVEVDEGLQRLQAWLQSRQPTSPSSRAAPAPQARW